MWLCPSAKTLCTSAADIYTTRSIGCLCHLPPQVTDSMLFFKSKEKPTFVEEHIENINRSQSPGSQESIPTPHARANAEATLVNPFANMTTEDLMDAGEKFAKDWGMEYLKEQFKIAALLARIAISENPRGFEELDIPERDKLILNMELDHKWRQPRELYFLVIMCSVAAAVQGVSYINFLTSLPMPLTLICSDGRDCDKWSSTLLP